MRIILIIILSDYILILNGYPHIPDYVPQPESHVEEACTLATACFHDTIPVCGEYKDKTRTFLDECDLHEYGCDTGQVHMHIDETPTCPDLDMFNVHEI